MSIRQVVSFALAAFIAGVGAGLQNPACAGSLMYEILADTSSLIPGPGGLIDINLGVSYPPGSSSVSALVYGPITDGVISPGASVGPTGTAAGDLTGSGVSMSNTQSTNELGQNFQVGSFFDVFVDISGPEIGSGAVGPWSGSVLAVTIYDSQNNAEGAMFTVNPNVDQNGNPIVDGTVGISTTGPQVIVIPFASIPEPSSIMLLGLGLGAVVAIGRIRRRRVA